MGFAEQLMLDNLSEASIYVVLLVGLSYMFYINLRTTIGALREGNSKLQDSNHCKIADLVMQLSELKNLTNNITVDLKSELSILSNNLQNFLVETKDVNDEVKQAVSAFNQETSRILNELIRIEGNLRKENNQDGGNI